MSHPFDITDYLTRPLAVGDRVVINDLTPASGAWDGAQGTILELSPQCAYALVGWDFSPEMVVTPVRALAPVV